MILQMRQKKAVTSSKHVHVVHVGTYWASAHFVIVRLFTYMLYFVKDAKGMEPRKLIANSKVSPAPYDLGESGCIKACTF